MRVNHLCAAAVLLSSATVSAQSEDAQWRALELINEHKDVIEFCQPCGDLAPGEPMLVRTTPRAVARDGDVFVTVNGKEMTLQNMYVRVEPEWYRNLALMVGIPPADAPPSLRVDRSHPTGELITPSSQMPQLPPPPQPESQPEPVPCELVVAPALDPPAAAAPVEINLVHVDVDDRSPGWIAAVALALSGVASTGMLWFVIAARARRRRTPLPKAVDLGT